MGCNISSGLISSQGDRGYPLNSREGRQTKWHVCLVKDDIEFDPNCLREMYEALRRHPDVGSCGLKMMRYYEPHRINVLALRIDRVGTCCRRRGGPILVSSQYLCKRKEGSIRGGEELSVDKGRYYECYAVSVELASRLPIF
jgi:hypothetical protein